MKGASMKMRMTLLVLTMVFCVSVGITKAAHVNLWQTINDNEDEVVYNLESSDENSVVFEFKLNGFDLEDVSIHGKDFKKIILPRSGDLGETGKPDLPAMSKMIVLPARSGARYEILETDTYELTGIDIAPLQPSRWDSDPEEPPFTKDYDFYKRDEFYPSQRVTISKPVIMRELRMLPIDFYPVSYNPATKTVKVIRRMKIAVYFEGQGENPKVRNFEGISSSFRPMIEDMVINNNMYQTDDYLPKKGGYLIISHSGLEATLQSLIRWKREKGHNVVWANLSNIGNYYSNIKNYIQTAYNTWEEPPEYVLLVGDVSGQYSLASEYYTGDVTDHKYSLLEGADYFADVQVGRISIQNTTQLQIIVNKIINYERNPYMVTTDWFKKGLMISHTIYASCKQTKQWIKAKMLDHGFVAVDTVWYSGSVSTWAISNSANAGVAWLNYRGYNDWGGWSVSDINALTNGWKLHVVTGMVCDTGDFGDEPCRAEAFLRAGWSPNNPSGAIAAYGPASLYTHTKWNNCIDMGFYAGVFDHGAYTASAALNAAKMELWLDYPLNRGPGTTSNSVECYSHEYNTLGDPGTEFWTFTPVLMTADFDTLVPYGTSIIPVSLTYNENGLPVEEAYVCLTQDGDMLDWGYTDNNGMISLYPSDYTEGELTLTITKHDHYPVHETINAALVNNYLDCSGYTIDDDSLGASSGNGDGMLNQGETIELTLELCNYGINPADNIISSISSADPYTDITQSESSYNNLTAGETAESQTPYVFSVSPMIANGENVELYLETTSSTGTSNSMLSFPVGSAEIAIDSIQVLPDALLFEPGDTVNVIVFIKNQGLSATGDFIANLISAHPWLELVEGNVTFNSLAPEESADNSAQPFRIATSQDIIPGVEFDFGLTIDNGSGFSQALDMSFVIGRGTANRPVGPDNYGYFAFGVEDTDYSQCPTYQWVNIASTGTIINLSEGGEQGDFELINLPFDFTFYGNTYNQVWVSSNGWLSFDNSPVISFYNYTIPSSLGPQAMIAPFWDDLVVSYGEVRYNYFSAHNVFVIAWNGVNISYTSSSITFEVILYDPSVYPTPTRDGKIVMQYNAFTNNDSQNNYCTIGIESPDSQDGLLYTFANIYDPRAATLTNSKAINFTSLYDNSNQHPVLFGTYPEEITTVEMNSSLNFKTDAYDTDGDELTYEWFQHGSPVGGDKVSRITFTVPGPDTVTVVVSDGENEASFKWTFLVEELSLDDVSDNIPDKFELGPLAPNPFNPTLFINYSVAKDGPVKIEVYNLLGQSVAKLVDAELKAGKHSIQWDASKFSTGMYLVKMEAEGYKSVKKTILLK